MTPFCGSLSHSDTLVKNDCVITVTRTYTATNNCGNFSECVQTITVQDTTAPVLSGVPAPAAPSATDNCAGTPAITFAEVRADGPCLDTYTLTRTWTATDNCGNTATQTQTITVRDTTAPVLSGVPANATIECDAVPLPATPSATDNCEGAMPVVFEETSAQTQNGSPTDDNYTITRRWQASDHCGNLSTATQIIQVQDTVAPVLVLPNHTAVECPGDTSPTATGWATATDNCVPRAPVAYRDTDTKPSFQECPESGYTIERTWTATDRSGNASTGTQTIQVGPRNCSFEGRVALAGNVGTIAGRNQGCGPGVCEPPHGGIPGGKSVWFSWVAPNDGVAFFDTVGSHFDTMLAVYTGTDGCHLSPVAFNDDLFFSGFAPAPAVAARAEAAPAQPVPFYLASEVGFFVVQDGEYFIAVDGFFGAEGEFELHWTVLPTDAPRCEPIIVRGPASQAVTEGSNVRFEVVATGPGELTYQWWFQPKGGAAAPLPAAVEPVLALAHVDLSAEGTYFVVVSHAGCENAASAALVVRPTCPVLDVPPVSQTVLAGTTVRFAAEAHGGEPLSYQWFFGTGELADNGEVSGAQSGTLELRDVDPSRSGVYALVVKCGLGEVRAAASLTVGEPPRLLTAPASRMAVEGSETAFAADVTGSPPIFYRWLKEGGEVPAGPEVTGLNSAVLTLRNPKPAAAGLYAVEARNLFGRQISPAATLAVVGAVGGQTVDEETEMTFAVAVTHPAAPPKKLTFSLDEAARSLGASIESDPGDPTRGSFRWTPNEAQSPGVYSITVTVADDGTPALSARQTFQVQVVEVNDAPEVATSAGGVDYVENEPAKVVDEGLTIADPDHDMLAGATVGITDNFAPSQDLLRFEDTGIIRSLFDPLTGELTLSGLDTIANYQAALRSVGYRNTSEHPSTLPRTITFLVTDGEASSAPATRAVRVSPINDPPTISAIANQRIDEDGATTAIEFLVSDLESPAAGLHVRASSGHPALVPEDNVVLGGSGAIRTVTVIPVSDQNGTRAEGHATPPARARGRSAASAGVARLASWAEKSFTLPRCRAGSRWRELAEERRQRGGTEVSPGLEDHGVRGEESFFGDFIRRPDQHGAGAQRLGPRVARRLAQIAQVRLHPLHRAGAPIDQRRIAVAEVGAMRFLPLRLVAVKIRLQHVETLVAQERHHGEGRLQVRQVVDEVDELRRLGSAGGLGRRFRALREAIEDRRFQLVERFTPHLGAALPLAILVELLEERRLPRLFRRQIVREPDHAGEPFVGAALGGPEVLQMNDRVLGLLRNQPIPRADQVDGELAFLQVGAHVGLQFAAQEGQRLLRQHGKAARRSLRSNVVSAR